MVKYKRKETILYIHLTKMYAYIRIDIYREIEYIRIM